MDTLPSEICALILEYRLLHDKRIGRLASISLRWQREVERLTFRHLSIKSTELKTLRNTFSGANSRRRWYLRVLAVYFVPPKRIWPQVCCDVARRIQGRYIVNSYVSFLERVFEVLAGFERDEGSLNGVGSGPEPIWLRIGDEGGWDRGERVRCACLRLSGRETRRRKVTKRWRREVCTAHTAFFDKVKEGEIWEGDEGLVDEDLLEEIRRGGMVCGVRGLLINGARELGVVVRAMGDVIVGRLEGVERVRMALGEDEWRRRVGAGEEERVEKEIRDMFSRVSGPKVEQLELNVRQERRKLNEKQEDGVAAKISEAGNSSNLSVEMFRHLSTSFPALKILHLRGPWTISPTFFNNFFCNSTTTTPTFPFLEQFLIEIAPETADGTAFVFGADASSSPTRPSSSNTWGWTFSESVSSPCNPIHREEDNFTCVIPKYTTPSNNNNYRVNREILLRLAATAALSASKMEKLNSLGIVVGQHSTLPCLDKYSGAWNGFAEPVESLFEFWYAKAGSIRRSGVAAERFRGFGGDDDGLKKLGLDKDKFVWRLGGGKWRVLGDVIDA